MTERIYRTALETQNRALRYVDESRERKERGLGFGLDLQRLIPAFSNFPITPVTNGLVTILGYTGNGKTTLTKIIVSEFAKTLVEPNDIIVYINYEESLEELALKDITRLANVKQSKVIRGEITDSEHTQLEAASEVESTKPIWAIADSIYDEGIPEQPNASVITEQLIRIRDEDKKKIRLVVIDYFQLMPLLITNPSREGHRRNATYLQRLGNMLGCPILIASQTNRNPQDRALRVPKLSDAAESSAIEKSSRAVYSVYIPWKDNEELNGKLKINGTEYDITPDMIVIRLIKQKHNPDPLTIVGYIDYDSMRLSLMSSKF